MPCCAIIYGTKSKIPRRIVSDDDHDTLHPSHIGNGESALVVLEKNADLSGPQQIANYLAKALGIDPSTIPHPRCLVVDPQTKKVVSVVLADENIDSHPQGYLINHSTALIGWEHGGGKSFRAPKNPP